MGITECWKLKSIMIKLRLSGEDNGKVFLKIHKQNT